MATSRMALPVMSTLSAVLWLAQLAVEHVLWPEFVVFVISTYFMIELNNRNALMRQYSRMVSCSYMAMMLMCPWLLHSFEAMAFQLCIIGTVSLLFQTYQQRSAMGSKYWAYLFFGLASFIWAPLLYFLPLFWIAEATFLMSFSIRSLWASILGVLTPVWVTMPYLVYTGTYEDVLIYYSQLMPSDQLIGFFTSPQLLVSVADEAAIIRLAVMGFVLLLYVLSLVHYLRNSYADKIHVRMLYQFFILISVFVTLGLIAVTLLPFQDASSSDMLLAMLVVCLSPMLAHYVAFTYTRLTNISVMLIMLLMLGAVVYQHLPALFQSLSQYLYLNL